MPRKKRQHLPLPFLFAELAFASWETIARRMLMMADGTCSPAEYARMVSEKAVAAQRTALAASRKPSRHTARGMLNPWHRGATANAKRLRRR